MLNEEIFREYDIRGTADRDLSNENVKLIGKAYGTYMVKHKKKNIVVGRDSRLSSDRIFNNLVSGIISTGCNVYNIGVVATPVFYFSILHYKKDGGMMITASHNPPQYNGFKICKGQDVIYSSELKKIYNIAINGEFEDGNGRVFNLTVKEDYINTLTKDIKIDRRLKVALDCGNGTAGIFIEEILNRFNLDYKILFKEPDGNFPNHEADPTVLKNLLYLKEEINKNTYDIGIAFDGDVDRIGVLDENGNVVYGDKLLAIYANEVAKNHPNTDVLFEVKCSQGLVEHLQNIGARPIMYKVGHSLIKAKMKEENILLGGEMSGHMFFRDRYYGFDDAFYAALRILEILSQSYKSLAELASEIPQYYSTEEIRVDCPEEDKFKIVEKLKEKFSKQYNTIDIDGIRVQFEKGWALIRASNTQPVLVLRFEAKEKNDLEEYINLIKKELKKNGLKFEYNIK